MPELTEEDKRTLERLRKDAERAEQIPESQRHEITNPDKYSFPIGVDDEGIPFESATPERKSSSEEPDCE